MKRVKNIVKGILVLLLITTIIHSWIYFLDYEVKVGIVLVDDCDDRFAAIAKEGLDRYRGYFSTTILDIRLDASNYTKNITSYQAYNHTSQSLKTTYTTTYLSKDFNNPELMAEIRRVYEVDMVVMVTDHPIGNWIDNPSVAWGEAFTDSVSCVATVYGFETDEDNNRTHLYHVAVHEVGHLLGFKHCMIDESCVMQYAYHGIDYCPLHSFELPYHLAFWRVGTGINFSAANFLINVMISLLFLPYILVYSYMLHIVFKRYLAKDTKLNILSVSSGVSLSMFILLISNYLLISLFVALFVCILVEIMWFLALSKVQSKNNKE